MIKDNKYFSTQQYVEPFIDRVDKMCQGNFIIKAQPANQISLTPQGDVNMEDIVFNRVWVQGILPGEYAYENHQQSINMLYALDTRKPLVKIFKNTLNMACLNMCVFSPEYMQVAEIEPERPIDFSFIKHVMEMTDNTQAMLKKLTSTFIARKDIREQLGDWIIRCIKEKFKSNYGTVKLAESTPIEAYKLIALKEDSPYFTADDFNCFDIYNAFTDIICNDRDKDIMNKYEKVYLVSKILNLIN